MESYSGLVLSSGSACGYYLLGAIHYLYSKLPEKMSSLKYIAGTSVGGLIATGLAIGYSPMELFNYICKIDIGLVVTPQFDIKKSIDRWGFIPKQEWNHYLTNLVMYKWRERFGENNIPTYQDVLEKTGIHLVCVTYQIHPKKEKMYLSAEHTPSLNIVDGMMMTTCIPGVFEKCEIDGGIYIDGGVVDTCPIDYVLSKLEATERVACIRFNKRSPTELNNIVDYFKRIISIFDHIQNQKGFTSQQCDDIRLNVELSQMTLNVEQSKRNFYFNQGKTQTHHYFFGKQKIE